MEYLHQFAECRHLAVVSYVPEPLGFIIRQLCGNISAFDRPQAHITLLPPRPLAVPLERAMYHVRSVLQQFGPFEVELSRVREFPSTNVLYLEVGQGSETLNKLHAELNSGEVAFEEEFEFHPHLTLAGPLCEKDLVLMRKEAEALWASVTCSRKFFVDEAVFLCVNKHESAQWRRVSVESLEVARAASL